ncbi:MAG: lysine--tRNA ligase [Elusimicrobia bacterium]|nr:lysine--tRNA ligase [Candidatus Obscuribacterium magneticum]
MSQEPTSSSADKSTGLAQLLQERRKKKNDLLQQGKRAFGRRYPRTHTLADIHKEFGPKIPSDVHGTPPGLDTLVSLAGRLLTRRDLGKLCFAHIHDRSGKLQLKISKQDLGEEKFKEFSKEVDIGDIIGVSGTVCRTQTGELSLQLKEFEILAKSLRPWPEKFHGLTDIEIRSRQRELDLATNPMSRDRFLARSKIIQSMRQTLDEMGFVEVETPLMQAIPGGALAKPFITHHEALNIDLYLRVAPELYLKRLLVGGLEKVYEIGRAFRNEGIDTRHNPEFTILEAYQAYGNVDDMMDLTEKLIKNAAKTLGLTQTEYRGEVCDLQKPFARLSLKDLFKKHLQLDYLKICGEGSWKEAAATADLSFAKEITDRKCFERLLDERILIHLKQPTFALDYPASFSPLAKTRPEEPLLADRFELFLAKEEVANAYTEQNDPDEQSKKLGDEMKKRQSGDEEAMPVDHEFIQALEYGMPPAGGLGIGVDRLTMVLTGTDSIREVILFPLLKPLGPNG